VLTTDVLGERMAGPAIRAYQIALDLSADHDVTLASTAACDLGTHDFRCFKVNGSALKALVAGADLVIFQGFITDRHPWLLRTDKILIADLYDPIHLEQLEQMRARPAAERRNAVDATVRLLNEQLARADFIMCASEGQRTLWLGQLAALGRINPDTYDDDSSLRSLIAVCPFGVPSEPARRTAPAIRDVVPGIGGDDKVIIWAGGVYNWFDPETLIKAVDRLRKTRPKVRLFFLGMQHPNPAVPEMRAAAQARRLADELGLTGVHVFYNEGWVRYDDRQNYLLDADVGVSTHFVHLETTFSFRTRILDYLWVGLPVVATVGDAFEALNDVRQFGIAIPECDVEALAAALDTVLFDTAAAGRFAANSRATGEMLRWPQALSPLREFCARAERAPDAGPTQQRLLRRPAGARTAAGRRLVRARDMAREGRLPDVWREILRRFVSLVRRVG